jgi:hypothetical protein
MIGWFGGTPILGHLHMIVYYDYDWLDDFYCYYLLITITILSLLLLLHLCIYITGDLLYIYMEHFKRWFIAILNHHDGWFISMVP